MLVCTITGCLCLIWINSRVLTLKKHFFYGWGLGRKIIIKLRFGSRSKKFKNHWFKPSPFAKSWLSANRQIFDDVISCGLWFRPPQLKILATPINWRLPEKLFLKTFFFENTCGCVFGPWPRAFLSLASRGSVLGKAVLGLEFFLHPRPWPRVLCPRLNLCPWS